MENTDKNLESFAADTVLNKPLELTVAGKKTRVPRPTLSTIIEVSKLVAKFPFVEFNQSTEKLATETIRIAKDFDGIENVLALLIIGAKKAKPLTIRLFGREIVLFDRLRRVAARLKDTLTPQEMAYLITTIFASMDCAFFLATIISLNNINHLKKTKN